MRYCKFCLLVKAGHAFRSRDETPGAQPFKMKVFPCGTVGFNVRIVSALMLMDVTVL